MAKSRRPKAGTKARSRYDAYKKERNRITRYLRDMSARGYDTSNFSLPNIPKRIEEASVRRLQALTPSKIRESLQYFSPYTGEVVPASDRAAVNALRRSDMEQSYISLYGSSGSSGSSGDLDMESVRADIIISTVRAQLLNLDNETAYNILTRWLNDWLSKDDPIEIANSLENAANSGYTLQITIADSYRVAKEKSINYAEHIMSLAGHSEHYISEMRDVLMEDY